MIAEDDSRAIVVEPVVRVLEGVVQRLPDLRASRDIHDYGRLHMQFHQQFMQLVQNGLLHQFIDQLYYRTLPVWLAMVQEMGWDEEVDAITREISQVVQALRAGSLAQAALARRDALVVFVTRLMRYLGGATTTPLPPLLEFTSNGG